MKTNLKREDGERKEKDKKKGRPYHFFKIIFVVIGDDAVWTMKVLQVTIYWIRHNKKKFLMLEDDLYFQVNAGLF